MCAEFAPSLLAHFRTPGYVADDPAGAEDLRPLRQLWLPNGSHLDMLHHLNYAYTFTKWGAGKRGRLNAFGRLCGWLFRESQRAGEQHILTATSVLRASYAFPAQDIRQGHLGFLLAWLGSSGDRVAATAAAAEAERISMSVTLDPAFERDVTEPLVEGWTQARRAADEAMMDQLAEQIDEALRPELLRRFELTVAALQALHDDPRRVNTGVAALVDAGLSEQWYQHARMELKNNEGEDGPAFYVSPETDRSPAAAGSRYQVYLASADLVQSALIHDDIEMQAEAIAAGEAFRGTVEKVWDADPGRASRPHWLIRDPVGGPLRLREGSWVAVVGHAERTATIRSMDDQPDGSRLITLEITGHKTKPDRAADPHHEGKVVTFVTQSAENISRVKSMRIWGADQPGAWLTHARPGGPRAVVVEEAAEDLTATTLGSGDV
jgi:hypothetical protein